MPLPLLADILFQGISSVPFATPILKALPWVTLIVILKLYFRGASNASERLMHSKVVIITVLNELYVYCDQSDMLRFCRGGHRVSGQQWLTLWHPVEPKLSCSPTIVHQIFSLWIISRTFAPRQKTISSMPNRLIYHPCIPFANLQQNGWITHHHED